MFRIGNATNNVTWRSFEDIAARPEVAWIVPISLGDSHRQFRVMGTTMDFFERYQYRGGRSLALGEVHGLEALFDAVIGADVAATLSYVVDDPIVVAHGIASFSEHQDQPFRIAHARVQRLERAMWGRHQWRLHAGVALVRALQGQEEPRTAVVLLGGRGADGGLEGAVVNWDMRLTGAAILLLVASWVPLLIVGMLDPTANPIGLGLLAMLGTAVAALVFGFAVIRALLRACSVGR